MAFLTDEELPRDPVQRRQQVLAGLVRLFGSRAKSPLAYFETDWSSRRVVVRLCVALAAQNTVAVWPSAAGTG